MARGGHALPKVLPMSAMPYPFTPCWADHPRNGLTAVSGVAHPQGRRPAAIFYPFGHPTPYAYVWFPLPSSQIRYKTSSPTSSLTASRPLPKIPSPYSSPSLPNPLPLQIVTDMFQRFQHDVGPNEEVKFKRRELESDAPRTLCWLFLFRIGRPPTPSQVSLSVLDFPWFGLSSPLPVSSTPFPTQNTDS
jgi:hypothetical protein